jgi:hypothetical protein
MTPPQRTKCLTSDLTGDRHMVTDQRWMLVDPAGAETVLCSPCCVIFWASYAAPAAAANSAETTFPADADLPQPTHDDLPHASEAAA